MTIADMAELHKSIGIARYALAHIAAKIECGDVDIADKALTKAAHITNKILVEISGQENAKEKTDANLDK